MRFLTAGESHGPQLTLIIEGFPAGLAVNAADINEELRRRQGGYGRGRRMVIEKDQVKIVGGIRHGYTTGAPIALVIENKDWKNWTEIMGPEPIDDPESVKKQVTRPRPGHADLNGAIKYGHTDMRNVLERSSARETAARVAVGTIAKLYLKALGIEIAGRVVEIGGARDESERPESIDAIRTITEASEVRCLDKEAEEAMKKVIDEAKENGDSVGGVVETIATGLPVGLGSHVHYDTKLDAKIAMAVMSINAFKGVEFGEGFAMASLPGSQVHDEIQWSKETGYTRKTNRLGGFEGGMTTGMPVVVRGVMKPIPTLYKPLQSVDIKTKEPFAASIERTDNCAVPAASVVCEHMVAWELAVAVKEKFGGDRMEDVIQAVEAHHKRSVAF
ncbi:chorismate synthase 1 [Pullulanibacillus camelliae]|uniref:Chorismate synthase n=1 Tax=Pullulanibacillus camelliae TaxID=1707096 RepID=A0A8J2YGF8_9BACL|nr:chorismate synthase [Pullulanibacillus camelliae]GGE38785.1 chorismate synthase 1 [Pullulanibacillus camelliae]